MPANIPKRRPPRSAATSAGSVPSSCPTPLAAARSRRWRPGTVSSPIPVPGGYSIIAVQDTRKVLTADPRDAVLSLKQVSISFPKGTTRAAGRADRRPLRRRPRRTSAAAAARRSIAADFNGEVVQSDQVKMRDLPPALQEMMLPMQVGQATRPFGSIEEGVRVLVMCGRDEVDPTAPSFDQVYSQLNEERVNTARAPLPARPAPRRGDRIPLSREPLDG